MKTIYEWYLTLKEPYRTNAITSCNNEGISLDIKRNSLYEAINIFSWQYAVVQGQEFHWTSIWFKYNVVMESILVPNYSKYLK